MPSSLIFQILATLGQIHVKERFIKGEEPGEIIYGKQSGELIEINPVSCIVPYIIHECLHYIKPDWPEAVIKGQTTRLLNRLTEDEARTIYQIYKDRLGA